MIDRHLPAEMLPRFPYFPERLPLQQAPTEASKVARYHHPALADAGPRPLHIITVLTLTP